MEKKRLVPKNRLKEMMKWLNDNPGKTQKDFVDEVIAMGELEIMKPEKKKKKVKKEKTDKSVIKLKKVAEVVDYFLGVKCELSSKLVDTINYNDDGKIVLDKYILGQKGNLPVIITHTILNSKNTDKEKLELFKKIFGNIVTVKLLK